jgi:hypothetical protein
MKPFQAARDTLLQAFYDGQVLPLLKDWEKYPENVHIQRAIKLLSAPGPERSLLHLVQAIWVLLIALELRVLAACNGSYIRRPRSSRCHRASPLPGQRACRACLTAYQRERLARRAAQQTAPNESNG